MVTEPDQYAHWPLSDRLKMLAFEAGLSQLPRSLIACAWEAVDLTWKPSEDVDREIRSWMKAKGWEVTRRNYDFELSGCPP